MRVEIVASDFTDLDAIAVLAGDHADATLMRVQLGAEHCDAFGRKCLLGILRYMFFYLKIKQKEFTIFVQAGVQNPVNGKATSPGGIAILSVYSRPSSMIPTSDLRSCWANRSLMPDLSIRPENQNEYIIL